MMRGIDRARPEGASSRRSRRAHIALAFLALAAPYAVGLALASIPAAESWLRQRISTALRARLGEVSLGERVWVDWAFRVSFGPLAVPRAGGGEPLLRIESARVRPALLALFAGRVEPASVELSGVRLSPGLDGRDVEGLLARRGRRDGPGAERRAEAPAWPVLRVRNAFATLPVGSRLVEVGPFDLDLSASADEDARWIDAEVRLPGDGRIEVALARSQGGWRVRLRARDLGPPAIPRALRSDAVRLAAGTLSADVEGEATEDLSRAEGRFSAALDRAAIDGDRVGGEIGPLRATASGALVWEGSGRRLAAEKVSASLLGAPLAASGEARLETGVPFAVSIRVTGADYRALVGSLPAAVAPPAEAPHPAGSFDAHLDVTGPLASPGEWIVSAGLDLSRMREVARRAPPVALLGPFEHRPEGPDGPRVVVGPASPDFVPIADLPEHVVRAVTTSEDAGFFGHDGFDFDELRNALVQGAEAGRVVRGGSTITQQLAKNLYLSPERTLARKIREAATTIALEASLPKRRLLEIYLNVAEWGPGLWGIGQAARHWFGKDARALTPKEAAFLATVIPNPVRYHAMFARGSATEAWEERVDELLLKMTAHGVISDAQLLEALREPILFAGG